MVWYALKNLINIKKFLPFILSKSYGEKFQKFVWETKTKQTVMCPSEFTFEFQSSEAVWCFVVITALLASAAAGHTDWTSPDCDCLLTAGTLETVSTEHCTLNHKEKINTSSLVVTNSGISSPEIRFCLFFPSLMTIFCQKYLKAEMPVISNVTIVNFWFLCLFSVLRQTWDWWLYFLHKQHQQEWNIGIKWK